MKKIHFQPLSFKKDKFYFILLSIAAIILAVNLFNSFRFANPILAKIMHATPFVMFIILFSRRFWYKNYVSWNRLGIIIKLNVFVGKNIQFDNIREFEITNEQLIIYQPYGTETFQLKNIDTDSINKLREILSGNI